MDIDLEDPVDQYINKQNSGGKKVKKDKKSNSDSQSALKKAIDIFKKKGASKDYQNIIDILATYLELHPDDLLAQKIMAFSFIELKLFENAYPAFKRLHSADPNDADVLNALAFLGLMEGRLEESINYMLDAIYIDDSNAQLKKNLESLKTVKDPKVFFRMTKPKDFIFIHLPKETPVEFIENKIRAGLKSPLLRLIIIIILVFIAGYAFYLNYPKIVNVWEDFKFKQGLGQGRVTHVTIQDINKIIEERNQYNIKLSEADIKKKFEIIKSYIEEKKHNRAMILINELLNSNASEYIKERVLILKDVMPDIDPNMIDFLPSIQEVTRLPFLYKDVYIRWYGTIANLEHKERKETVFDLLINFVENAVVEGIAESHFTGFQSITSGEKVAVFGQIAGITVDNKIIVKGLQIQRLGK